VFLRRVAWLSVEKEHRCVSEAGGLASVEKEHRCVSEAGGLAECRKGAQVCCRDWWIGSSCLCSK